MKVLFVLLVVGFFQTVSALGNPPTIHASVKPLSTEEIRKMITGRLYELQNELKDQEAKLDRLNNSMDVNDIDQERALLTNEITITMNEISRLSDLNVGSFPTGITNRSALYQEPPQATPEKIALLEKLSTASEMERQIILKTLEFPNEENQEALKTMTQAFLKFLFDNLEAFQVSEAVAISLKSRREFDDDFQNSSYDRIASDIWLMENPPDYYRSPCGHFYYGEYKASKKWPCSRYGNYGGWGWGSGGYYRYR